MRKIDKSRMLSEAYKNWVEDLDIRGAGHPDYDSSSGITGRQHYLHIVMNLFHCQDGLCAYTEARLCSCYHYSDDCWENGVYNKPKPESQGQLDHFDPRLKKTQGWAWHNFFMVHTDVNTKIKGSKNVDEILKPDNDDYDEFKLLFYDCEKHVYIANPALSTNDRERVRRMIEILGINFDPIYGQRKRYIISKLKLKSFGVDEPIEEFPTAFEMIKRQLP